jgi:outer membrane protein OmpA-like peptidoglycan-associated protein
MDQYTEQEIWNAYTLAAAEMGMRCPQNPEDFNPALHDQACPKYYELREISLLSQKCPDNPASFRPGVDDDACPKYYELRDQYTPEQWAVVTLLSKRDTDKDTINDYLDVCPTRQEDFNNFADQDGCPDGGVVAISGGEIMTYRPVYFAFNSSQLSRDDKQVIDLVVGAINSNRWIKRVRVAGNADAIGSRGANLKISKRRSRKVIDYMRSRGVRGDVILIPVAYGADKPVASNRTEQGRALNRRVFFAIDRGARGHYVPPRRAAPAAPPAPVKPASEEKAAPIPGGSSKGGVPSRWDY